MPGVSITQHSGSGKANQYFLCGFNLDHGTDFRVTVDGIPVNLPSHGHGQGYTDLNFLIPELVEAVRYKKGAYSADKGDFSAAGAADMSLVSALDRGILQATPGEDGYRRALVADSFDRGEGLTLSLDAFNLFDEEASDIDYFYESRLPGEAGPVSDVHFHPAERRTLRLTAEWRY